MIESGPMPAIHGVVRWRVVDLGRWMWAEFQVSVAEQTLSRELRPLVYRKLSVRPRHPAQHPGAIPAYKTRPRRAGSDPNQSASQHDPRAVFELMESRWIPESSKV